MSTIQNIITFDYAIAASPCAHYTSYYTWICRQHKSVPHYTSCYDNQISYIVPLPVVVFSAFHKFTLLRIISWSPLYSCCQLPALCCIIPPTRKCSWGSARNLQMTLCLMILVRSLLNRFLRHGFYQFLPCQPKYLQRTPLIRKLFIRIAYCRLVWFEEHIG